MKISLCFLTFNRMSLVRNCFKSMKADFEDPAIEILIWDNASSDGTAEWLLKMAQLYPNVHLILSARNEGVAGARRLLFPQATGDVIISLDSDVQALSSDWKRPVLDGLDYPDAGIVGAAGYFLQPDWTLRKAPPGKAAVDILSGYCHAFRRAVIAHTAGPAIDAAFNYAGVEDDDFCLQFKHLGLVNYQVPVPLAHRFSGTWSTGSAAYLENRRRLRQKWGGKIHA